jgi:choline dehydrogenase-like flavoprotein
VRVRVPEVAERNSADALSERSGLVGILKNKIVDYYRKLGRVVDASVFPSSGAVNPALTVIANALRVGDHLLDRVN